jgi:Cu2+-exporting ATPase
MNQATAHLQWSGASGLDQVEFFADGMHCANCARSIRRDVGALPGVQSVDVNLVTGRVHVAWQHGSTGVAAVLDRVRRLGFRPVPLVGDETDTARRAERRTMLKRLGLAGLAAMQMSMYTIGLYFGVFSGMEAWLEQLLRVTAMLISLPVMFYSGAPFLRGAWFDLRRHTLGMDVPVAAAMVLAFAASVYNTWRDAGDIYFDSVAMFIFFLLLGRFAEQNARRGSLNAGEALARSLPAEASLLEGAGTRRVPLASIAAGDRLLVAHGAVIPVDGELESTNTLVDESLVTGEALPITRSAGARLPGGAINLGPPCTLRALAPARDSTIATMAALIERAQSERAPQARAADRAAGVFVAWIVVLAMLVAAAWLWIDPSRAFDATLAVLVVTCPCALSLATPVALAAATTRLARRGMLVTRAQALERLAGIDTVMLDKTGTLTEAHMRLGEVHTLRDAGRELCLAIAASLEQQSAHPLAAAFIAATPTRVAVGDIHEASGQGLEGTVAGARWRIGRRDWVLEPAGDTSTPGFEAADPDDYVWLGNERGAMAAFELLDSVRPEAAAAMSALRAMDIDVVVASGDRRSTVNHIAAELGIQEARGRLDPAAKQAWLRQLQASGHRVLMVCDGINDGPVLAAADAACAMGRGAALAHAAADLLLMSESLASLPAALATARGAAALVRSNLRWALGYNLAAVPLAACGLVPPWLAAVGMSASSLYVVLRAQHFAVRA